MSRIYFHSPSGDMEIRGSERAYMRCLINDIAVCLIDRVPPKLLMDKIEAMMPRNCYVLGMFKSSSERTALDALKTWLKVDQQESLTVGGCNYNVADLVLNTGFTLLGDPGKLFARLHGSCEIHAFCEGRNRSWLASIVQEGIESGLYRDMSKQWSNLADWLRSRDDEPVVTSYSGSGQFPNPFVAGHEDDWDGDEDQLWERSMERLRSGDVYAGVELTPDNWKESRFGHGKDMLWILNQIMAVEQEGGA